MLSNNTDHEKRPRKSSNKAPPSKRARSNVAAAPKSRISELEETWDGLLRKENSSLLNRLVEGNKELQQTFQQYQAKMESIALCSKECLESTQNVQIDNRMSSASTLHGKGKKTGSGSQDVRQIQESERSPQKPPVPRIEPPFVGLGPSIIFQAAVIEGWNLKRDEDITANHLCESVMAWKVRSGPGWDFTSLLRHLEWRNILSLLRRDSTVDLILAPNFYSLLLDSLHNGTQLDEERQGELQRSTSTRKVTGTMWQRRSIAFCTWAMMKEWRPFMSSQVIAAVAFWMISSFLIFLAFPTEENLKKIPPWLWPTTNQFTHEHPAVIDFLLWPWMRAILVHKWRDYDLPVLFVDVFTNLEVHGIHYGFDSHILKVNKAQSHLEIDSLFEPEVFDLRNFRIRPSFFEKYPNLTPNASPNRSEIPISKQIETSET